MVSLLCSTRYDPSLKAFEWNNAPDGSPSPYLLLAGQLDRVLSAHWPVFESLDYAALKRICDEAVRTVNGSDDKTPLKVRVVFPPSGDITASALPVDPLRFDPTAASQFSPDLHAHPQFDPILSICFDTLPTSGTLPLKTTNRQPYDDARTRVGVLPLNAPRPHHHSPIHPHDVILFNTSGAIMESSICNVAFHRHGRWFTPPLTVGCISGVFRRWLLENGRIYEADKHLLSLDTIQENEWVLLFNGVAGCRLGQVHRSNQSRDEVNVNEIE